MTAGTTAHGDLFAEHRSTMVGAAYRILGSVHDAEDAVQEVWPRWAATELALVHAPRSYLVQAATRQALNRIREQQRRREDYIGPWLPEPVADVSGLGVSREVGHDLETAESVSMAMLVVLGTLSPAERAAFVLREVFDLPYAEVARTLQRSEDAVRQLVSRARAHVHERAPRRPVDAEAHRAVTERFLEAVHGGSLDELVGQLAPDVMLTSDGGGRRNAALRPIEGPERVLRFVVGVLTRPDAPVRMEPIEINGRMGIGGYQADGTLDTVVSFDLDGPLVRGVYVVRNPEKLSRWGG